MHLGLQGGLRQLYRTGARLLALAGFGLAASLAYVCVHAPDRANAMDTSILCAGYSACGETPFTTHGYENHAWISWWRMYAGDNCTNYAAFVESQVYGVTTPTYLLGDADQWAGTAAAHGVPVDATPSVGAVAAWGSDTPGMGGFGHVAVVEAVGPSDSYIDVSQSGMGEAGDGYDWERIYATQASWEPWPTDFIHFIPTGPATPLPAPGMRIAGAEIAVSDA